MRDAKWEGGLGLGRDAGRRGRTDLLSAQMVKALDSWRQMFDQSPSWFLSTHCRRFKHTMSIKHG